MVRSPERREVINGPTRLTLGYAEELEVLTLSTGRPKRDNTLLETCFLQVRGNRVSDEVDLQTADHVSIRVALSYRVNFEGDSARWFDVKNYVGLLCDHLRSILRGTARALSVDDLYSSSTEVIRNAILGQKSENGLREGRHFEENGMWVYDVEVLDVCILDEDVDDLLCEAQRTLSNQSSIVGIWSRSWGTSAWRRRSSAK